MTQNWQESGKKGMKILSTGPFSCEPILSAFSIMIIVVVGTRNYSIQICRWKRFQQCHIEFDNECDNESDKQRQRFKTKLSFFIWIFTSLNMSCLDLYQKAKKVWSLWPQGHKSTIFLECFCFWHFKAKIFENMI